MRVAAFAFCVPLAAIVEATDDGGYRIDRPHPVVDPAYGDILFRYYQRQNFAAMTAILVALERNALPVQADRARVLLGALYADYEMPAEAERLFDSLLEDAVDAQLASRIWMYLADIYYRRGRYQEALDLVDNRVVDVAPDLRQYHLGLRTRLLMKLGRYDDTRVALDQLDKGALSGYLRYNLAVSRINAGEGDKGVSLLWQLVNLSPGDDEINALKDKAMLALGVHYLRSGQGDRARSMLGAARVEGPYSEMALLLHARAWLASDTPDRALPALRSLGQRSMQFEEAQEAGLALPFLYEKLGDLPRARQAYRDAITGYTGHYSYLAALEQQISEGRWFEELVAPVPWTTAMDPVPVFAPAGVESFATFRSLFATHAFQKYWRAYHEQQRQLNLVRHWIQRLPAMNELLAAHIRKHRADIPAAQQMLVSVAAHDSAARLEALETRLEEGYRRMDPMVFATGQERDWLQGMVAAQEKAQRWSDRLAAEKKAQLDLMQGTLLWQILSNIEPRHWLFERRLQEANALLDESLALRARISRLAAGDQQRITALGYELAGLHNRLATLDQRGSALSLRLRTAIEQMALQQVRQTRERLQFFTAECWAALGDLEHRAVKLKMKPDLPDQSPEERSAE